MARTPDVMGEKRARVRARKEAPERLTDLMRYKEQLEEGGNLIAAADIAYKLFLHGVGKPQERREVDIEQVSKVEIIERTICAECRKEITELAGQYHKEGDNVLDTD